MAAMSPSGCLSVVLNASATPEDMLKAYFVCVVFWEKVRPFLYSNRKRFVVVRTYVRTYNTYNTYV